ncbi:hypothetical protein [Novosphingobium sp.]|uniref:hypothetical protein n=1 Tax=Novosphingobium sp. TaxID=1874826 RepID=UPI0026353439|nr:hypothetical protein [Novosphingobium sp.]
MSTFRQKVQATTNWVKPNPEDIEEAPRKGRRAAASRSGGRRSAPVTAHRLFPAFAAVWFGALFGLGSFAIPSSLLGALVLKTGLPALVPAAAPPLGFTAHLLVAILLTGFGAALGLALALRLSPRGAAKAAPADAVVVAAAEPEADEAYKVRARDAHPDAPPRRPLVLTEAFADPLVDEPEPAAPLLRRKPGLSDAEPMSDGGPWIPEFTPGGAGAPRPLDLSALDLAALDQAEPLPEPVEAPVVAELQVEALDDAEPAEPEPAPQPALLAAPESLLETEAPTPAAPALIAATPQLPAGFAAALPDVADGSWSPVAGAPLESLGLVQLIERLALAIAAQKASNVAVVEAHATMEAAAEPQPQTQPAPQAQTEPEFEPGPFSRPQPGDIAPDAASTAESAAAGTAREAILRRLGALVAGEGAGDMERTDAGAPAFARPAATTSAARGTVPTEAVVPLRPSQSATAPFAAAAPGAISPASTNATDTDEALRSALATLQRMTARG